MEPSENLSILGPHEKEGDELLSGPQMPPIFLPPGLRPPPPLPQVKPFQLKSLYWVKEPRLRSPKEKPPFWKSVHLLSVFAGQEKGGKARKPWNV